MRETPLFTLMKLKPRQGRQRVEAALVAARGDVAVAAERLGVNYRTLLRLIRASVALERCLSTVRARVAAGKVPS